MQLIARDVVREPLFVIVPVFNPWRWKSRDKHTQRTIKHFHDSGAVIVLVEVGFGRRELVYANSGLEGMASNCTVLGAESRYKHMYIGLHSKDELWLKENAINVGGQHLTLRYPEWQQVAWIDSDVMFVRPNWVGECIHKLQHGTQSDIAFIQMFSQARDVGPNYELLHHDYPHASGVGFAHAWKQGMLQTTISPEIAKDMKDLGQDISVLSTDFHTLETDLNPNPYPGRVFPGLAWGCTRRAWDATGGLLEEAIWGGGDWHMSHALIEKTEGMMRNDLHRNYKKIVNQWYQRCRTQVRRNVLVMDGTVLHNWHGKKVGRGYNSKHALLAQFGFDPLRHLKKDASGLWQLNDDRSTSYVQIRDMLRRIAVERNEDDPII